MVVGVGEKSENVSAEEDNVRTKNTGVKKHITRVRKRKRNNATLVSDWHDGQQTG